MDEESLRNRLVSRLKEQRQTQPQDTHPGKEDKLEDKTLSNTELEGLEKSRSSHERSKMKLSNAFDSEISSGEMTEGNDEVVKKKEHTKELRTEKKERPRENSKSDKVKKRSLQDGKERNKTNRKSECKGEKMDNWKNKPSEGRDKKQRSTDKQREPNKKKQKRIRKRSKSPSSPGRSQSRRDGGSPRRSTRDGERRRSTHSQRRYGTRSRDYARSRSHRSKSPGRRRVSDARDNDSRKRCEIRRDSRDWQRRPYSRPRSRSMARYRISRSDSTTSFSISSYGSDMDTLPAEKNVVPATSTTNPPGFGQGLYIPQSCSKGGIADLLSSIKQGQPGQQKGSAIAKYTALCQQISAREGDRGMVSEAHVSTSGIVPDQLSAESKFKWVEEEFPCSHGSEHRKATFDSEVGTCPDEPRPFTDQTSINKMMLGIKPGQFTGDKAAMLPFNMLEGGDPAWAKKHQFKKLAPLGDGFGRKLMEKMGWREGMALGKTGHGVMIPLELDVKTDRKGLGVDSNRDPFFLPPPPAPYPPFQIGHPVTSGTATPRPVVSRLFEPNALDGGKHPVCVLMEICAKKRWDSPVFEEVGEQRAKSFKFKVSLPTGSYQPLQSSINKKEAKKQAAMACLQALGQVPSKTMDFVSNSLVPPVPLLQQPLRSIHPPCHLPPPCPIPIMNTGQVFTPPTLLRNPPQMPPNYRPPFAVNQLPFIPQPAFLNHSTLHNF